MFIRNQEITRDRYRSTSPSNFSTSLREDEGELLRRHDLCARWEHLDRSKLTKRLMREYQRNHPALKELGLA